MKKYVSNIKKMELEVSDEFANFGINNKTIEQFLAFEGKVKKLIDIALTTKDQLKEIKDLDLEIVKLIESDDANVEMKLTFESDDRNELHETYSYLANILVDIANYFVENGMLRKGLYVSYVKHLFAQQGKNRDFMFEQIDHILLSFMGEPINFEQTITHFSTGAKTTVINTSMEDTQFTYKLHIYNCYVGALMKVDRKMLNTVTTKTIYNDAIKTVVEIMTKDNGKVAYVGKHANLKSTVDAYVKEMIDKANSLKTK